MASGRILIVDDDEAIRLLLERVCQREGYRISLAGTVQDAIDYVETQVLDVAVIDLRLPDGSGLDVLKRAKTLQPDSEAIMLTGYGDLETAAEALRLGAYDYLQKEPFSLRLVPLMIERALERQQLTRNNEQLISDLKDANRELGRQKQRVLQVIHHLGQALSSGMQRQQLTETFVRALLDLTACEGAALLTLPDKRQEGILTLGSAQPLSSAAENSFVSTLLEHTERFAPLASDEIEIATLEAFTGGEPIDKWHEFRFRQLESQGTTYGLAALACSQPGQLDETTQTVFNILVNQGTIALQNAYLFERMSALATRDSLTELYNHGHFFELLEAELNRSQRRGYSLAVIMLDLDRGGDRGLKYVNDHYGHQAGDALLRAVGQRLRENVRATDVVARYGGDEFTVLAPETGPRESIILAQRLRQELSGTPIEIKQFTASITASIGVAVYEPSDHRSSVTANDLVEQADEACYRAKDAGGDRIRTAFENPL